MFKKILVALDLDHPDQCAEVLRIAAKLAEAGKADIRLVYVRFAIERALDYLPDGFMKEEEESTRAKLVEMAKAASIPEDRVSVESPIGSIYDQVLAVAEAFGADLIVMGAHRPSVAKYLLGGNASRIVARAEASVLVVR